MNRVTVYVIAGCLACFGGGCLNYSSFDEMAAAMCEGSAPDVGWSALPNDAFYIDVRYREEFNVSHLKGARHCEWVDSELHDWQLLPRDSTIIVYCSVGKRSEAAAEFLMSQGFKEVYNLKGGLFDGFNRGIAIDGRGNIMDTIHGYNVKWGQWITRGVVVYE
jgi:rhodanese-related sulfurtransferase